MTAVTVEYYVCTKHVAIKQLSVESINFPVFIEGEKCVSSTCGQAFTAYTNKKKPRAAPVKNTLAALTLYYHIHATVAICN